MQRVVAVKWSLDNKFILSASEEMNLRVWKASASAKLGVVWLNSIACTDCIIYSFFNCCGHFHMGLVDTVRVSTHLLSGPRNQGKEFQSLPVIDCP